MPERLWKFLVQIYGGSPPLPRQVIRYMINMIIFIILIIVIRNKSGSVELELSPLAARILKHQTIARQPNVPTLVGGYSAAALQVRDNRFCTPVQCFDNRSCTFVLFSVLSLSVMYCAVLQ